MENFIIRDSIEGDVPFVCDSMWRSSKQEKNMSTIKQIVYDKKTKIKIACLPNDQSVIIGYKLVCCEYDKPFIYVKVAFRNMGVENSLENT